MGLSGWELLVALAIVLLVFGPKRLKNLGSDLGNAIKGFRRAVSDKEETGESKPSGEPKPIDVNPSSSESSEQRRADPETHA